MTQIQFPNNQIIDFGDLSELEIQNKIESFKTTAPQLFEKIIDKPDFSKASFEEARQFRRKKGKVRPRSINEEKELLPEIKDKSFRFNLGRMDTDKEKLNYIQTALGSKEAVQQDSDGSFIVDQELLTPEIRQEFGLGNKGFIYANKPGFTTTDLIDFLGGAGAELVAGIAASVAVAGTGGAILPFLAAVGKVGAATAGGRALDEAIEYLQGYNKQSFGDVASQIAVSGALGTLGEGGGRAVTALGGRLFKGKGPRISQERVEELERAGLPNTLLNPQARKAAQEEARQQMNKLIREGGVPTVEAAADKTLLGTLQQINELILPNRRVAEKNKSFIANTLKKLEDGKVSSQEARQQLTDHAKSISNLINQQFVKPSDAVKNSKNKILPILQKQMEVLTDRYSPITGLPTEFDEAAKLSAQLYTQATRRLYSQADDILKEKVFIDADPIIDQLDKISENKFFDGEGALFNRIRAVANTDYNVALNKTFVRDMNSRVIQEIDGVTLSKAPLGKFTLEETQQMKEALRIARGDSDLIATGEQKKVDDVLRTIEDAKAAKHEQLATTIDATQDAVTKRSLTDGLNIFREANKFWADGQNIYNNAGVNAIIKDAKAGKFVSNQKILDQMDTFDSRVLKQYLDAVTPPITVQQLALTPTKVEALEQVQGILSRGDIGEEAVDEINGILQSNGLTKIGKDGKGFIVREIPEWMRNAVQPDFKKAYLDDYAEEISNFTNLARAGVSPERLRNNIRESLAKKWIENTTISTRNAANEFNPKGFASAYFRLGEGVRKELFGKNNIKELDQIIGDFHIVDITQPEELIGKLPTAFNESIQKQLGTLSKQIDDAKLIDANELTRTIRTGNIQDPKKIASALLEKPNAYDDLVNVVGEEAVEGAGGIKDMVMFNLLEEPLEGLSQGKGIAEDFLQSGKWGSQLKNIIEKQNRNNGLDKVLGEDTVRKLNKLADNAITLSDSQMAGTSIAGPGRKVALATLLFGSVLNPTIGLTAAASLIPIFLSSRLLRNKTFLDFLTKPRLRASEFAAMKRKGVDLTEEEFGINKLLPIVNSQLGILTASGLFGSSPETDLLNQEQSSFLKEQIEPVVQEIAPAVNEARNQLQLPDTNPQASMLQEPRTMAPNLTASEVLASVERDKLLGIT